MTRSASQEAVKAAGRRVKGGTTQNLRFHAIFPLLIGE
jgi:hypothetical protein